MHKLKPHPSTTRLVGPHKPRISLALHHERRQIHLPCIYIGVRYAHARTRCSVSRKVHCTFSNCSMMGSGYSSDTSCATCLAKPARSCHGDRSREWGSALLGTVYCGRCFPGVNRSYNHTVHIPIPRRIVCIHPHPARNGRPFLARHTRALTNEYQLCTYR